MVGFGLVQMQDEPVQMLGLSNTLAALDLQAGGRQIRKASRRIGMRKLVGAARVGAVGLVAFVGLVAVHEPCACAQHPRQSGSRAQRVR